MITHKISKQTKTDVTLHISVDAQFIDPYQKSVLKRLKKDLKVDGFRPGNVPDKIAERELGAERVQAEVLEEVVMHAYTRAA
jgi:trigger factor